MQLTLAIASCSRTLLDSCVWHAAQYAGKDEAPINLVAIGNGVEVRPDPCVAGFNSHKVESRPDNIGVPAAMHKLYLTAKEMAPGVPADQHIILFMHDDLRLYENNWNVRLCDAFRDDPEVALAGFAGTEGLGHADLYKADYHLSLLSRQGPLLSNLELHAEFHGERTTAARQVVFVDGFALAMRRSFLDEIKGWSWWPSDLVHHAYDYGIACMVKRHNKKVRLVPVRCDHGRPDDITHERHSGTTSMPVYKELAELYGGDAAVHAKAHQFVYDTFKDVLPIRL